MPSIYSINFQINIIFLQINIINRYAISVQGLLNLTKLSKSIALITMEQSTLIYIEGARIFRVKETREIGGRCGVQQEAAKRLENRKLLATCNQKENEEIRNT